MTDFIIEFIENYKLSNPDINIINLDELIDTFKKSFMFTEYIKTVIKDNYTIQDNNIIFSIQKERKKPKQIKQNNIKEITQKDILTFINNIINDTQPDILNISKLYNSFKSHYNLLKYQKSYFINLIKTHYTTDEKTNNILINKFNTVNEEVATNETTEIYTGYIDFN